MYGMRKSKPGVLMPHGAVRRLLLVFIGFALLTLGARPALAQSPGERYPSPPGIGIFTEGLRFEETIYVPGKPGEGRSAPTVQDAVDMAKGRTYISVNLPTSPGFMAEGKEIAVGFVGTTVDTPITFVDCPMAVVEKLTSTSTIEFLRSQNILVQFAEANRIIIEDSSYAHVTRTTITHGLYVRRSAGVSILENSFMHAIPSLNVRDCNDPPPASPPPLEWARYLAAHPVSVESCTFRKIVAGLTITAAALIINSRLSMQRCVFEEFEARGVESHDCADVSLQNNTFIKAKEAAIFYFNSEGFAQGNKIRGVTPGSFGGFSFGGKGIEVLSLGVIGQDTVRRSRVKIEGNEIYDAYIGIDGFNSTVDISGNSVFGGTYGIRVSNGSDGSITGGLFRDTGLYGIALDDVAPGFLVESTTMDSVKHYGMVISLSKQVTVKNVEWRAQCETCDRAEMIRQPVPYGGIQISGSEVTLDNVRIHSQLGGFALLIQGGHTI